ncbi:hypothetical protein OsJ_01041 [Oryza sativa Japonica Group]|uniref:Uncharacterized protein n=1 Tax=Oryza sativa subsp. japonica TaxID=39947 RepID=B9EUL0_ORYSJ|nr:hypothetical protein OsJ_01041 [Oryza sativa Japonica Group]
MARSGKKLHRRSSTWGVSLIAGGGEHHSTASSVAVTATECGCLDDVNGYAVQFNAAAKNLLEWLNAKLPGASISLADCYSIVMELIEHPQKYGLKLVTFNAAAKNLLEWLNAKLPGASISLADCYSIVMELIEHPQKYGLKLVTVQVN